MLQSGTLLNPHIRNMELLDIRQAVVILILFFIRRTSAVCAGVEMCDCEVSPSAALPIINCRNRGLTSFPAFQAVATQFSQLTLAGNSLTAVPDFAFQGLNFSRLDLSGNPIVTIDNSAFSGVESMLTELMLNLAPSADFPSASLTGLENLRTLQVSGFGMSALPSGALGHLVNLQELRFINSNLIELVSDDLLSQQHTLRVLNLQYNQITDVANVEVGSLVLLNTLVLTSNLLTSLPANIFSGAASLENLDLSYNGIGNSIDSNAFQSIKSTLKVLNLAATQTSNKSLDSIRPLSALAELNLQLNSISNIPSGVFKNTRDLRQLYLNDNQIRDLGPQSFTGLSDSLLTLYLGYNPLSGIQLDTFSIFNNLQELNMDGSTGLQLDANSLIKQRSTLRILSLMATNIGDHVWPAISPLVNLQTLVLSKNKMSSIPKLAFQFNNQLRSIDLSSNNISRVTQQTLYGLQGSLVSLNLINNGIATVDRCVFDQFQQFDYFLLSLTGNPLKCDCELKWLFAKLASADPYRFSTLSWRCSPSGKPFYSLTDADFGCSALDNATLPECTGPDDPAEKPAPLMLNIGSVTTNTASIMWSVNGAKSLQGFTISYEILHSELGDNLTIDVGSDVRSYTLTMLSPGMSYSICVSMNVGSDWLLPKQACDTLNTPTSDITIPDDIGIYVAIVLGSVIGALAVISSVVVLVILLVRKQRRKQLEHEAVFKRYIKSTAVSSTDNETEPPTRNSLPKAGVPHAGYGSRRYAKSQKHRRPTTPTAINTKLTFSSEPIAKTDDKMLSLESSITAEEREKFLAILTEARVATQGDARGSGFCVTQHVPNASNASSFEAGCVRPNGVRNTDYRNDDFNVRSMSNIYEEIPDVETGSDNEARYRVI